MRFNTITNITSILKKRRIIFFSFFVLFVNGCTTVELPTSQYLQDNYGVPETHLIKDVPLIIQDDHYCGPAALATVAQYNDEDISQDDAASMVYTPGRKGTFQHDMVTAIWRTGMLALPVNSTETLIQEIASDNPVIIFQNLGFSTYPIWHYSVVTGYDFSNRKLQIHSGKDKKKWQHLKTIAKTWKRASNWGYMAIQPGTIPVTSTKEQLLQSAAGLEAARHLEDAKTTYVSISEAFPNSPEAWLGLGNIYMAQEKYSDAETAYTKALSINPDYPLALNNMAYSLKAQNKTRKACRLLESYLDDHEAENFFELEDSFDDLCLR